MNNFFSDHSNDKSFGFFMEGEMDRLNDAGKAAVMTPDTHPDDGLAYKRDFSRPLPTDSENITKWKKAHDAAVATRQFEKDSADGKVQGPVDKFTPNYMKAEKARRELTNDEAADLSGWHGSDHFKNSSTSYYDTKYVSKDGDSPAKKQFIENHNKAAKAGNFDINSRHGLQGPSEQSRDYYAKENIAENRLTDEEKDDLERNKVSLQESFFGKVDSGNFFW